MTGAPKRNLEVVIAYAYGASDWKTVDVRRAFAENLAGIDLDFQPVDWRPFLPSPQAHLMRFIRSRDGEGGGAAPFPARADLRATASERRAVVEGREAGRISLDPLTRPAMRVVHHAMVDHAGITMADVLGYLRNPEAVLRPVTERLREVRNQAGKRPVVAVGLSLGGIILVDSLARLLARDEQPADLLVTVGSQSAALRAMGVMPSAPRDELRPRLFTPWLNVWHEHDYLSYPAGAMFEFLGDVTDRRAVQRGAFPGVHSGYLNRSSRVFDHLGDAIRERFGG